MSKRSGNPRGGKREGAGRRAGVSNAATEKRRAETRQAIEDDAAGTVRLEGASAEYIIAAGLLKEAKNAVEASVRLDAYKHLDNRLQGRPREALEISGAGGGPLEQRVFRARLASGEEALAPPPAVLPTTPTPRPAEESDAAAAAAKT